MFKEYVEPMLIKKEQDIDAKLEQAETFLKQKLGVTLKGEMPFWTGILFHV